MEEEAIPQARRAWCPQPACGRMLDLPRATAGPEAAACVWCDAALCAMCAGAWEGHEGGRTCADAKVAQILTPHPPSLGNPALTAAGTQKPQPSPTLTRKPSPNPSRYPKPSHLTHPHSEAQP